MTATHDQLELQAHAAELIRGSWVGTLVRSESKRKWLASELADALAAEHRAESVRGWATSEHRDRFAASIASRIKGRNCDKAVCAAFNASTSADDTVGDFIILPIILAAVLSWLIGRLLDWYFPQAAGLTSSPCETCNCAFGVQTMAGWKTYIVSGGMILYAVAGMLLGKVDPATAIATIMTALGLSSVASDSKNDAKTVVQKLK